VAARPGIDTGAVFGTKGTPRIGAPWNKVNPRVETGDSVLPSVREITAGQRVLPTFTASGGTDLGSDMPAYESIRRGAP